MEVREQPSPASSPGGVGIVAGSSVDDSDFLPVIPSRRRSRVPKRNVTAALMVKLQLALPGMWIYCLNRVSASM